MLSDGMQDTPKAWGDLDESKSNLTSDKSNLFKSCT